MMNTEYDVDVIQMSDFRLPGGTTSSIAEEVRAQSEAGLSTAMVHLTGAVTNYPLAWSSHVRKVLDLPGVRLCTPHTPLRAKVLVIRHPTVLYSTRISLKNIHVDHVVVVANHAAIDAAGTQHYDVAATDAKAREVFGKAPIWAPIGPVVRGTMLQQTQDVPLRESDWFNIFSFPVAFEKRTDFVGDRPIIGRHSRPQRGKWPDNGDDILAAYPNSDEYQVCILGGAQIAQRLLGQVPEGWEVIPFGGEDPTNFLKRIDFWVYMHHPDLKEAFGRAAMESLAAGCVAVMPPYMEELFGDAALYAQPQQVRRLIDEYAANKEKFLAQSHRAQDFARRFSPQMHIDRLAALGADQSEQVGSTIAESRVPFGQRAATQGPTLLLIEGEQTERTLSACIDISEAGQDFIWVEVGESLPFEQAPRVTVFVSSARRMNMTEQVWNEYFNTHVTALIARTHPGRVVYSGALPTKPVLDSLKGTPVDKVWIQQPRHNPEAEEHALKASLDFHTVLAPDVPTNELRAVLQEGLM